MPDRHEQALQWISHRGPIARPRAIALLANDYSEADSRRRKSARHQAYRHLSDLSQSGHIEDDGSQVAAAPTTLVLLPDRRSEFTGLVYGARSPALEERLAAEFGRSFTPDKAYRSPPLWRLHLVAEQIERARRVFRRISQVEPLSILRYLPSLSRFPQSLEDVEAPVGLPLEVWNPQAVVFEPQVQGRATGLYREQARGVRRWFLKVDQSWKQLRLSEQRSCAMWWVAGRMNLVRLEWDGSSKRLEIRPTFPRLPVLVERALRLECRERLSAAGGSLCAEGVGQAFFEELRRILGGQPV